MSRSITVNTHQAKIVCAMLLDVAIDFECSRNMHLAHKGYRMFDVSVCDSKHASALAAVHASVLRRTAGQPSK